MVPTFCTLPPNTTLSAHQPPSHNNHRTPCCARTICPMRPSPQILACAPMQASLGRCGGGADLTAAPSSCVHNPAVVVRGGRRNTRCRCTCRTPRRCTARRAAAAATAAAMERPAWRGCAARWRRGAWWLWWRALPPPRSRCPPSSPSTWGTRPSSVPGSSATRPDRHCV